MVTLLQTTAGEKITLVDSSGLPHVITSSTLLTTLALGWAAFALSLVFNFLFYALHPSQVLLLLGIIV